MNYFEDHIGDYAAATAHLSWDEDMAYTRLIRAYYHHEKPIPAEIKAACRIARAQTPAQREAVKTVLEEFFTLQEDGWHQKRCDAEIARYQDKQNKARRSAAARWDAKQPQSGGNANASPDAMRTHTEGNAPIHQTPDTRHQTPDTRPKDIESPPSTAVAREPAKARGVSDPEKPGTPAGAVCKAMRQAGIPDTNPGHPRLLTLLNAGATSEEFLAFVGPATDGTKGSPFAYVLGAVEGERKRAAQVSPTLRHGPMPAASGHGDRKTRQLATAAVLTGAAQAPQTAPETIDVDARIVAP